MVEGEVPYVRGVLVPLLQGKSSCPAAWVRSAWSLLLSGPSHSASTAEVSLSEIMTVWGKSHLVTELGGQLTSWPSGADKKQLTLEFTHQANQTYWAWSQFSFSLYPIITLSPLQVMISHTHPSPKLHLSIYFQPVTLCTIHSIY